MAKTNKELRDEADELAAQCWTDPETSSITMDVTLAQAVAKRFLKLLKRIDNLKSVNEPPAPKPPGELMTVEAASVAVLGGVSEVSTDYYFGCIERIAQLTGRDLDNKLEAEVAEVLETRAAIIDVDDMLKRRKRDKPQTVNAKVTEQRSGTIGQIALAPDIPTPTIENLTPPN